MASSDNASSPAVKQSSTTMVEQEQEESGWTSYLDTEDQLPSLSLQLSDSSHKHHTHSTFTDGHLQAALKARDSCRHSHANTKDQNRTSGGNLHERSNLMQYCHEESCGSSTLSDANSSSGRSRKVRCSSRSRPKLKSRKVHYNDGVSNSVPSQDYQLEDTATSSPSSNQIKRGHPSRPDISVYSKKHVESEVSKRFKALEALIPSLKEMAGEANEEEMLNAIISHVRALELRVQLLSDVWRISHGQRADKSHCLSPIQAGLENPLGLVSTNMGVGAS